MIWSVLKSLTGLQGRKLADWHASSDRAKDALARAELVGSTSISGLEVRWLCVVMAARCLRLR
jgi:hypothetical protein